MFTESYQAPLEKILNTRLFVLNNYCDLGGDDEETTGPPHQGGQPGRQDRHKHLCLSGR